MKVRLFSSIAVACCVACPWQWLAAEEEIKYPSPDGRFVLRITKSKDDEYHPTVELIEKQSGTVLVTLHNGQEDTDLFDASETVLVWSADSKSTRCFCRKICHRPGSSFPRERRGT